MMKGKTPRMSPTGEQVLIEVVCKAEPLRAVLPKLRRLENQAYLQKKGMKQLNVYKVSELESRISPLQDKEETEEKFEALEHTVEEGKTLKLDIIGEDLFPTDLNDSLVKLPDIQSFYNNTQRNVFFHSPGIKNYERSQTKSPPTLGNILRTAKKASRRPNFNTFKGNKFEYSFGKPVAADVGDEPKKFTRQINRIKRIKQDYLVRLSF